MDISLDEGISSDENGLQFTLKNNAARAKWTCWTIGIVGVSSVVTFASSPAVIRGINNEFSFSSDPYATFAEYADYFSSAAWLAASIAFFHWFRRAYSNVQGLGYKTKHTDGWAIGYFFIPIVSLIKPYTIMNEIIKANDSALKSISEPSDYETRKSSMNIWWISFLLSSAFSSLIIIILSYLIGYSQVNLLFYTAVPIIMEILAVIAAVYLVNKISIDEKVLFDHQLNRSFSNCAHHAA